MMSAPRRFDRFDYFVWGVLTVISLAIGLVILIGDRVGARVTQTFPSADRALGAFGRVGIEFAQAMEAQLTESHFSITPSITGTLTWENDNKQLWFTPAQPFAPEAVYTARLSAGAPGKNRQTSQQAIVWTFRTRSPEIVFMAPTNGARELWRVAHTGGTPKQLTQTGGQIYDFAIAPDGERLVYSASNEQRGTDLWVIDRDGNNAQRLVACAVDQCTAPDWSRDGLRIAYSREPAGLQPGAPNGPPRVWTVEVANGQTAPLYQNSQILGYGPVWSPDGRWLAAFDGGEGAVRVLNLFTAQDMVIDSAMGTVGSFSPDGRFMLYNDLNFDGTSQPYVSIYKADLENRTVLPVLGRETNFADFAVPAWSPSGEVIAVALRGENSGNSKQLWLLTPDGQNPRPITTDPAYTVGGYRWNAWGTALVFQRLELNKPFVTPEVVVWELATGNFTSLTPDGSLPHWLP